MLKNVGNINRWKTVVWERHEIQENAWGPTQNQEKKYRLLVAGTHQSLQPQHGRLLLLQQPVERWVTTTDIGGEHYGKIKLFITVYYGCYGAFTRELVYSEKN